MLLTDIPAGVMSICILPYLQLNDLLRLRRVNKYLKSEAEEYLRVYYKKESERYVIVSPHSYSSPNFDYGISLDFVVPVSRMYIQNKHMSIWCNATVWAYLDKYGDMITHLKLDTLVIPMLSRNAFALFESLPNLEHLFVEKVCERGHGYKWRYWAKQRAANNSKKLEVPSTFKRLKTLKITEYKSMSQHRDSIRLVWKFIDECSDQLEYIYHPYDEFQDFLTYDSHGNGAFGDVERIVERRRELIKSDESRSNLKYYDLKGFTGRADPFQLDSLLNICAHNSVKLLNFNAVFLEELREHNWSMENHREKIAASVESLNKLYPACFLFDSPHLTSIVIKEVDSYNFAIPSFRLKKAIWLGLKNLDLDLFVHSDSRQIEVHCLLDFFFVGIVRERMTSLKLQFRGIDELRDLEDLKCPNIRAICNSCPNLKVLNFGMWPGTNKDVSEIWGNLPSLEEVTFKHCTTLGNEAFVGCDRKNPSFLLARRLKCLHLEDLDYMPAITNSLFTDVLRHMPLKQLYLTTTATGGLESVTVAGIASLLFGEFAETIEKFPFAMNINIRNVSKFRLIRLESKFRTTNIV